MAYIANDFDGIREAMRERGLLDEDKEKLRQAQERASAIDRELLKEHMTCESLSPQIVGRLYRRNGVVYPMQRRAPTYDPLPPDEDVSLRSALLHFGFFECNTGGGCMALEYPLKNGGCLLVTDGHGAAPDEADETAFLFLEDSTGAIVEDYCDNLGCGEGFNQHALLHMARKLIETEV